MSRAHPALEGSLPGVRARAFAVSGERFEERLQSRVLAPLGYQVALNGAKGYAGVATLTKGKPDEVIKGFREPPEDSHCRILNVLIGGVRIYNLYVPNGTALGTDAFAYKLQWLERLRVELDAHSRVDEPLLLCGDFNIAPDARDLVDPASMVGCTHFSPEEHAALARLQPYVLRPMTWFVLTWEVGFAAFVGLLWLREATGKRWFPDLRRYWLGFGALMHLGIWAMMYVVWFTPLVLAAYTAFLRPEEAARVVARVRARLGRRA